MLLCIFAALTRIHADESTLHNHPEWWRLLHYKKNHLGQVRSDADYPLFFISENGAHSPQDELKASVRALVDSTYQHHHAPFIDEDKATMDRENFSFACVFPERAQFLIKQLKLTHNLPPCTRYNTWRQRLATKSVTLVFASAYLGNPASTFGHTFLRLNSGKDPLLDYGVNYAAAVQSGGGVDYAVLGIFGGYPGSYSILPYHVKVQEYSQGESRDLWEYPLNLTPKEVDRLIGHLWELGLFAADYYFFRRNCSYEILTLLEYARPDVNLSTGLLPWVIPGETVRIALNKGGFLEGQPTLRPSLSSTALGRLNTLNPQQSQQLKDTILNHNVEHLDTQTLDALSDYLEFKKKEYKDSPLKRAVLITRAARGHTAHALQADASPPPHHGHDIFRVALGVGSEHKYGLFTSIDIRPSLHELVAAPDGYVKNLEIEIPRIKFRYYTAKKKQTFSLESIDVARVTVLSPLGSWFSGASWHGGFGVATKRDTDCNHCLQGTAEFGYGLAGALIGRSTQDQKALIPFAFADVAAQASAQYDHGLRLGPGATLGALLRLYRFSIDTRTALRYLPIGQGRYGWRSSDSAFYLETKMKINLSLFTHGEARLELNHHKQSRDAALSMAYYF